MGLFSIIDKILVSSLININIVKIGRFNGDRVLTIIIGVSLFIIGLFVGIYFYSNIQVVQVLEKTREWDSTGNCVMSNQEFDSVVRYNINSLQGIYVNITTLFTLTNVYGDPTYKVIYYADQKRIIYYGPTNLQTWECKIVNKCVKNGVLHLETYNRTQCGPLNCTDTQFYQTWEIDVIPNFIVLPRYNMKLIQSNDGQNTWVSTYIKIMNELVDMQKLSLYNNPLTDLSIMLESSIELKRGWLPVSTATNTSKQLLDYGWQVPEITYSDRKPEITCLLTQKIDTGIGISGLISILLLSHGTLILILKQFVIIQKPDELAMMYQELQDK